MATTAVDIVVKVTGQRSLDKITSSVKKSENAINNLDAKLKGPLNSSFQKAGTAGQAAANKIKNAFRGAAKGAEALSQKLGGLRSALLGFGVGAGLSKAFGDAAELQSLEARAGLLVKRFQQLDGIQKLAAESAKKFRVPISDSLRDLTDLGSRIGSTGTSLEELRTIYDGFNTLLAVNKVSAQGAAAAQLQLNQALGSGVLNGEEFNTINEQTPQLLDAVAKVLGVQRGELKKLASEGVITKNVLIKAFADINKSSAGDLEGTFTGAFKAQREFNKALKEFSTVVGQELLPAFTPLIQAAAGLLQLFGKLPKPVRTVAVALTAVAAAALLAAPAIASVVGVIKTIGVATVAAAAVAFGKIALIVAAIVGIGAALVALSDKWEPFRRATFAVSEFVRGVFVSLKQQFADTTKSWSDNSKKFSDFFVGIFTAVANFFQKVGNKLKEIWAGVVGFFNERLGFVVDFFEGIWNGILQFFGGIVNQLKAQWRTFVEFVVNSLVPLGNVFKAFGINIGEAVANGVANAAGALAVPRIAVERPSDRTVNGSGSDNQFSALTGPDFDGGGSSGGSGRGSASADDSKRIVDDSKKADEALRKTKEGIENIVSQANDVVPALQSIFRLDSSPLQEEIRGITDELLTADGELEKLLIDFDKLAKGDPQFDSARSQITAIREKFAAVKDEDILRTASENLTQGDREGFEQSLREAQAINQALKEGRTELTATEKLAVKYGDDWANINQAVRDNLVSLAEGTDKIKAQNDALRQQKEVLDNLYTGIGDTIENGIISAIDAGITSLVEGTKSLDKALQEIASGVLKDIGNQLISFGVNAALSGLGNSGGFLGKLFGGGRAEGGSVSPDKTFLVGEKGPELFTPTTNGTIIPNDFFDSAREALRSPGSGSVAADNPEAFAAAAAAIQRNTTNINNRQSTVSQETSFNNFAETLGSQKRETIRFETVRVGEMDMVTKDEALKIGAESAKAAEASVFNALKNKPSVRKSIGMS